MSNSVQKGEAHVRLEVLFRVYCRVRRNLLNLVNCTLGVPYLRTVDLKQFGLRQVYNFKPVWEVVGRVSVGVLAHLGR